MARRLRTTILVVVALALGLSASAASAAFLPGCANPADSALSQYCDTIPTPAGAERPQAGGAALATTLAPRIAGQIVAPAGTRTRARRRLLTLPAAGRLHSAATPGPLGAGVTTSPWTLSPGLVGILIVLALGLGLLTRTRWRRQRAGTN